MGKARFGVRCPHNLCEWLFSKENHGATITTRNNAEYDSKLIHQWFLQNKRGLYPDTYIRPGGRIMCVKFN